MSHNGFMDDQPWLVRDAVLEMDLFLRNKEARVLEWGAGGSTLWFAARAKQVVSIEHDLAWHARVTQALSEARHVNVALTWISEHGRYPEFALELAWGFDLILVDGVHRNECIKLCETRLHRGGWLVLDNTERTDEYAVGVSHLRGWARHDFVGDWQTSIFVKP